MTVYSQQHDNYDILSNNWLSHLLLIQLIHHSCSILCCSLWTMFRYGSLSSWCRSEATTKTCMFKEYDAYGLTPSYDDDVFYSYSSLGAILTSNRPSWSRNWNITSKIRLRNRMLCIYFCYMLHMTLIQTAIKGNNKYHRMTMFMFSFA